jgi:hypothetical protein
MRQVVLSTVSYAAWFSAQKPAGGSRIAIWIATTATRLETNPTQITSRAWRYP